MPGGRRINPVQVFCRTMPPMCRAMWDYITKKKENVVVKASKRNVQVWAVSAFGKEAFCKRGTVQQKDFLGSGCQKKSDFPLSRRPQRSGFFRNQSLLRKSHRAPSPSVWTIFFTSTTSERQNYVAQL